MRMFLPPYYSVSELLYVNVFSTAGPSTEFRRRRRSVRLHNERGMVPDRYATSLRDRQRLIYGFVFQGCPGRRIPSFTSVAPSRTWT